MRGARSRAIVTALSAAVLISAGCSGSSSDDTAQQGAEDDFRVAVLTSGPVNDNGYNADAQRAADYIAEEHGAEVAVSESVPVPNQADVYRQFAQQGYDLVIGWGGQYSDGAVEVSAEFPDVTFLVVNSNVENGSNLGSLDHAIEDWHFMVGWLQAKLSKTGVIGWIGAQCFPATAAGQHGTEQGAEYADPDITIHSTFTGDFEDPTKARQAATAMIESGADVLSGNLNNAYPGVFDAARSAGDVLVITEWADNHEIAPDVIVSSVLKSLVRFVGEAVETVQDGTFAGEALFHPLPEDWGPILSDTELLPDELYEEALEVQAKIASGEIDVEHDETCE